MFISLIALYFSKCSKLNFNIIKQFFSVTLLKNLMVFSVFKLAQIKLTLCVS